MVREGDAEEAETAKLAEDFTRKGLVAVPPRRVRLDLAFGEIGQGLANLPLLVSQFEVHDATPVFVGLCCALISGRERGTAAPRRAVY